MGAAIDNCMTHIFIQLTFEDYQMRFYAVYLKLPQLLKYRGKNTLHFPVNPTTYLKLINLLS